MNILITNDDGIFSDGIIELAKKLSQVANVYVVAPDSEKSAIGHAITIHSPLMVKKKKLGDTNINAYAVSGTPADCVKLGIEELLKDINIDLVLSGINNGPNLGTDVIYSGTVSGAMEGLVQNKPSIAVSYDGRDITRLEYAKAAEYVAIFISKIKDNLKLLDECMININIPDIRHINIKGFKITQLGIRRYENTFEKRIDPRGNVYYWLGGKTVELPQHENSDVVALKNGFISVTPLKYDITDYDKIYRIMQDIESLDS
ncbi:5'-nucleotidase /3'-nucleotidase /exopolyphosphatase [Alkalithermobacter thermoalcaliphilus JW-YL-7 = DSM 7308]|uniref:5'-nucleotidase SurE n=1 Tax=Alkalithermobacter thermoalcaliphilus JW-YL-7 = DSM 7308 TaxID=1121328 RepID=A0A150FRP8_CLOPD|nr:Survival protein SurE-like phosphatase/nucleotidase [[Clostridium] paradoxum JW-YL-7 = DSM 7308]SHK78750.1 5'-nucleotidase /3'-nucleotidase /exopolyphosphatase [[Clostridium] paradoxum JW-YL-7 = DSM 7308]